MEMTLDDMLAEIDRWKEAASARRAKRSAGADTDTESDAWDWLESKLGRPLREAHEGEPEVVDRA